ncbi:hypothetical protein [Streptomyces sp. NBC_01198]|uniref:hypothetical protein n=1 Tax=Streptomyces sp. NBC_01198 TaxID=2903769 RepID=UPI002E1245BC|nr:hypothetical protein OG702_31860 [Streptomyces sp. NBC_01198]
MDFEYALRVPALANGEDGWEKPAKTETVRDWAGTAHDLGRLTLKKWRDSATGWYAGLPAIVEVHSEHGHHAVIDDPTPASGPTHALEVAIEEKQVADLASDIATQTLEGAMRDAHEFDGLSKNNIAHRARFVVSRPTALGLMKGCAGKCQCDSR